MSTPAFSLGEVDLAHAPDHPVLAEPWRHEVLRVDYRRGDWPFGSLVLELAAPESGGRVRLRFDDAHEFEVDAGFPFSYMGLEILDTAFLGRPESAIRVQGFEDAVPGIRFWARAVERLPPP
jgi:hypothetical protein